jgi:hypothetical protein
MQIGLNFFIDHVQLSSDTAIDETPNQVSNAPTNSNLTSNKVPQSLHTLSAAWGDRGEGPHRAPKFGVGFRRQT